VSLTRAADRLLAWLPRRIAGAVYRTAGRVAPLRRMIDAEQEAMLAGVAPPRPEGDLPSFRRLPAAPLAVSDIVAAMERFRSAERAHWVSGGASGAVYHGASDHIAFLNQVYALQSQSNPLHADVWPSAVKFEAEVVAMTAAMLGRDAAAAAGDEIVGTTTSGGTESIIMAMKAYRDRSGAKHPEMVLPTSAHVAFDKAAHYLGFRQVRVPVASDFRADVAAMERAISRRTVVVVGSAPGFPHGVIDPIAELAELARARGIGFHTDACLGGFVLPWAERLGYPIPGFDFRLAGVTSMSVDTHKYGYAAKGTSVVLYRGRDLLHHQYFVATDWPGGLYYSQTMPGSRPGGLVATAWAALLAMGEDGYSRAAAAILQTGATLRAGIEAIPQLRVLGDPLWVIAFTSDEVDIYEVMAQMTRRGWSLNGLHQPPAVHLAVTLRHTQPGVSERFLDDLHDAVVAAGEAGGKATTGAAPLYGMAATFPARQAVGELLRRYIDRLYDPE
jgi:sphinganine-1-phosphate aldolase